MHKPIRTILYIEQGLNLIAAMLCLLMPDRFVTLFLPEVQPVDPLAAAFVRWYGVLLIVISYVMIRALMNGSLEALKPVLQAFLIGDVLHIAAHWMLIDAAGGWTTPSRFTMVLTVLLALIRVYALWARPDLVGSLHPSVWASRRRRDQGTPR